MCGLAAAAPAAAPAHVHARDALAVAIANAWPAQQRPDGRFGDYLNGGQPMDRSRYAEAMLGYALLETGVNSGRRDLIDAGLRALRWAVGRPYADVPGGPSVFENLAVASAYNIAARHLADDAAFAAIRPAWEAWLRHVRPTHLHRPRFTNKHLVDAVVVLELCRSGLGGGVSGAVLADCGAARRQVDRLLDVTMPAAGRSRRIGGHPALLLSDPPHNPLAYHALTAGMLARAIELGAGGGAARQTLARLINASWALAAPDGSLAYVGRSNEQAWALAFTAYAAQSADLAGTGRERADALAARALGRLRTAYPIGSDGLRITPALGEDLLRGVRGVDRYAGAGVYNGLTLVALNWAFGRPLPSGGRLLADGDVGQVIGRGRDELAIVRSGRTWFAVKRRPALGRRERDLRMDFGLIAFKRRIATGWRDVSGPPPITNRPGETAGPLLIRRGRVGRPIGDRIVVRGDRVHVVGRFVTRAGRVLRTRVRFTFRPVGRSVRLRVSARRGDRIELSAFLRAGQARVRGRAATDGTLAVAASAGAKISTERGYHSATAPNLVRARVQVRPRRAGPVVFAWTGR